jgi:hypothetical protein
MSQPSLCLGDTQRACRRLPAPPAIAVNNGFSLVPGASEWELQLAKVKANATKMKPIFRFAKTSPYSRLQRAFSANETKQQSSEQGVVCQVSGVDCVIVAFPESADGQREKKGRMKLVLVVATLVLVASAQFPCNSEACSQLGEACSCLSQICCDASLNCTGGVCVGTPSTPNNDQIQLDFPNGNPSLSYTGIFQEASRYTTREVYDAYSYPLGLQEPTPTRLFQVNVEVGSPPPCCSACSVGASSFSDGTNSNCYASGSCVCDPSFYEYANCSLNNAAFTLPCPGFSAPTSAPTSSAQMLPLAALCLALVLCVLLA